MDLPVGWDNEIKAIRGPLAEQATRLAAVKAGLIASAKALIEAAFEEFEVPDPRLAEKEAWQRIRDEYDIPHPERTDEFESGLDAAQVIVHYWLGKAVDADTLTQAVMGFGDTELYKEAVGYAHSLTDPNSPQREYVDRAVNYLWQDYSR